MAGSFEMHFWTGINKINLLHFSITFYNGLNSLVLGKMYLRYKVKSVGPGVHAHVVQVGICVFMSKLLCIHFRLSSNPKP